MSEGKSYNNLSADRVPTRDAHPGYALTTDFDELRKKLATREPPYRQIMDFSFERATCQCGSITFYVLQTDSYETSAKCTQCSRWYVVADG